MFNEKTREFQKGLDADARRRDREDDRLRLRKEDRELRLIAKKRIANDRSSKSSKEPINQNPQNLTMQETVEMMRLPQYVQGCFTEQIVTQFECCQRIRKLLSIEHNPPILEVIQSGVVPRLVQFLQNTKYEKLQFEAAWALTNIASGTPEHTAAVIRHGAVPLFVRLLTSSSIELCEQVVWALGNIAGDSPECRNLVLEHHVLDYLLQIARPCNTQDQARLSLIRNATWALSNLVRGKPSPPIHYTKQVVQALSDLLINMNDFEVKSDACWGFSYLSDSECIKENDPNAKEKLIQEKQKIELIQSSGALKVLVNLISHNHPQIKHPALRAVGNIVTGEEEQTQMVLNLGVLDKFLSLLNDYNPLKKETCWAISNITAGSLSQVKAVIRANLVPALIKTLDCDRLEIQKESVWALSNMTSSCDEEVIRYLVGQGIISSFCKLLTSNSQKLVQVILEALHNILNVGKIKNYVEYVHKVEECGGLDNLEKLQTIDSFSDDICKKAADIVKVYFAGEYDDDNDNQDNIMEGVNTKPQFDNNNQFAFSLSNSERLSGFNNNISFQF